MRKKIYIIMLLCLFFCVMITQYSFAKYVMSGQKQLSIYIDKTPPVITVTNKDGTKESFPKTQSDVVKRTDDVTLDTSDNIKIDHNEIYYNPTENNFDGKTPTNFDDGKKLTDEGYYKIVAVDTSGNKTEIIILLDKSAPNVTVQFYKKGEIGLSNDKIKNGGADLWS